MKFSSIALAAALAVAASSSFAKVKTDGDIGQAEYVFIASNGAGSYFQDLGVSIDGLAGLLNTTGSFTQSVTGTQYSNFLNFGGTNTQWAIIAVQPLADGFAPGEINTWTTANVNQPLGVIQNSQSNDASNNLAVLFGKNDNASNPKVANNTKASAFGTPTYIGNSFLFSAYFNARNAVGATANMVYLTPSDDVSDNAALYEVLKNTSNNNYRATFNGTTVSIAAAVVPEPSSYALLVAGLAAVGFVARRRQA